MHILTMNRIKKSYADTQVLKGIDLCVAPGEVVSIIGPSGSGKSTLLRCATLLTRIDSGEIIYDGMPVAWNDGDGKAVYASRSVQKKAARSFGLVFQNFNLFPHYTVMKNLTDAQVSVLKLSKQEAQATAEALLEKMGLSDKAQAYPCQLSGGQQQRVAIARALAMKPEILFFDEPTSALDPELTGEILKVIRQLAQEHMTMVIVTHEMRFAREVSDRVVFMDNGAVVEQGAPEKLFSNPDSPRLQSFLAKF
ncbi:MAG: amino acid ABC transporter ATP-binding protein [Candidatus Faecousia sp.]|nr:amino acid ABC transporter ATP-binding protein [Candidatus Faecousia sp.]